MRREFEIDINKANRKMDEQRRVIEEVSRLCFLKEKLYYCRDCPVWEGCGAKHLAKEEAKLCVSM